MAKDNDTLGVSQRPKGYTWLELRDLARVTLDAGVSVLMLGHPGVGKSALAKTLASEMKIPLIDIRLAQKDPAEIGGVYFPDQENGVLKLLAPDWVKKACNEPCFVFLDEINAAVSKLHQAAAYQIVLEKRVGPFIFHPKTVVMGAGNLEEDNAIVAPLSSALANRFAHFQLRVDKKSWVEWGLDNGIDSRILGYISWMGEEALYLNSGDTLAFPSPRSWEMASKILQKSPHIDSKRIVTSCVGEVAAEGFASWLLLYGKVDPEAIVKKGQKIDFTSKKNNEPSFRYAAIFAVGSWVVSNLDKLEPAHLENLMLFANSKGLDPEYQFLFIGKLNRSKDLIGKLKVLKSYQKLSSELVSIRSEFYK